jgi:hypothetical protein
MGCWHGWHGCGPWYGPTYDERWYEPDRYGEAGGPTRRRYRRGRRGREEAAEDLADRLGELRQEVLRLEAELMELRGQEEAAAEGP